MRPSKPLCGLGGGEVFTLFALGVVCLTLPPTRFFLLSWSSPIAFCGLACPVTHLLSPRPLLCERPLGIDYYLQVAILTPEGNNPPSTGKVAHTTGVYIQYSFQCKVVRIHLGHTSTTVTVGPTRPTAFLPYPRRLQSLTVFRCHYEGS